MLRAPAGTPGWGVELIRQIEQEFINRKQLPVQMPSFSKANLPDASLFKNCWIKVFDDAGGDTAAESDGANWRRMQDRAVIS
ncbi:MAG: hypothetical protein ACYCZX_20915 [Rhodospirillaceae bacterium]